MSMLQGTDAIIAWVVIIGVLCWWAYSEGFFDSIINKNENKNSDEEE